MPTFDGTAPRQAAALNSAYNADMLKSLADWHALHSLAFNGVKALVTGGAGFIGSHLTLALTELGADVTVLDDLSNAGPEPEKTLAPAKLVVGSILDQDVLAKCVEGQRFVFHQAALGSVPRSIEEPRQYDSVNVTGTLNVLEAARAARVQRVMFAASSSVYGDSPILPKVETMPTSPRSPYAATKAAAEAMVAAYSPAYGLDTVSLRYFNIFGPRQRADSAYAAVIAAFAKSLLAGERPVIFGDGTQSRDFTYVDNAVHANLLAARSHEPLVGAAMNIACGQRTTVNELARIMAQEMQRPDLTPIYKPARAGDVPHSLADLSLAGERLGYGPIVSFAAGLAETVRWYTQGRT
jgi:nucleoside-diphosphate-sugar epimerase